MYTYICISIYIYIHIYIYINISAYIHIYMHRHTHKHTYIYRFTCGSASPTSSTQTESVAAAFHPMAVCRVRARASARARAPCGIMGGGFTRVVGVLFFLCAEQTHHTVFVWGGGVNRRCERSRVRARASARARAPSGIMGRRRCEFDMPPKHLDTFKGAPLRLPKPLSISSMCVCTRFPFVYEPSVNRAGV